MENKQTTLAAILGAFVILAFFIAASLFVGQKIKDNFAKPTPVQTISNDAANTTATNLLQDENKSTTSANKYKTIPSTGPEQFVLILLPAAGAAGYYLRKITS